MTISHEWDRPVPNNPVEQVSWDDTQSFIQKLNTGVDGYLIAHRSRVGYCGSCWDFKPPITLATIRASLMPMLGTQTTQVIKRIQIVGAKLRMHFAFTDMGGKCLAIGPHGLPGDSSNSQGN